MQLTHNNITYEWIGEKWWFLKVIFIELYDQYWEQVWPIWQWVKVLTEKNWSIFTSHTPDQLVKMWYMKVVEEKSEEKEKPEWTVLIEEATLFRLMKQLNEVLAERLDHPTQLHYVNNPVTLIRNEIERRIEEYHWCAGTWLYEYKSLLTFIDNLVMPEEIRIVNNWNVWSTQWTDDNPVFTTPSTPDQWEYGQNTTKIGSIDPIPEPKLMYRENWRPESWTMIEVSNDDRKNWIELEFVKMDDDWFVCKWTALNSYFRYAKPLIKEWEPSPWEIIEVSNDGDKWEEREFEKDYVNPIFSERNDFNFITKFNGKESTSWWKYARPIKKVVELPEFDWDVITWEALSTEPTSDLALARSVDHIWYQLEAITAYLKQ